MTLADWRLAFIAAIANKQNVYSPIMVKTLSAPIVSAPTYTAQAKTFLNKYESPTSNTTTAPLNHDAVVGSSAWLSKELYAVT
jgi:hypothetical protein